MSMGESFRSTGGAGLRTGVLLICAYGPAAAPGTLRYGP